MPTIRELPDHLQPARRVANDPQAASDIELIAAILGTPNALETAAEIVARFPYLNYNQYHELANLPHMGPALASRLLAALEWGRRSYARSHALATIHKPEDIYYHMLPYLEGLDHEEMYVCLLNGKNQIKGIHRLYSGTANYIATRVAEFFRDAIRYNCPAIAVAHNHPSGNPEPSPEDWSTTQDIIKAGQLLNIDLVDHIIIGQGRFVSLKERTPW